MFPVILLLLLARIAAAQTLSGVPGYLTVPVATFNDDRSLQFGASFLPADHLAYTNYQYNAVAAWAGVTFLSFVEVDLRVTRQLGLPDGSNHVVDRVPTVRFRVLKEKKWVPAVALGFHDVLTSLTSGEAHHFGATYIVVTKNFDLSRPGIEIGATLGWGAAKFPWENAELIGLFGGVSLGTRYVPWLRLLCDYDGATVNAALRATFFKRLCITAGTLNFDSFTGSLCYRFSLPR